MLKRWFSKRSAQQGEPAIDKPSLQRYGLALGVAEAMAKEARYAAAYEEFSTILTAFPEHAYATRLALAEIDLLEGRAHAALTHLTVATSLSPSEPRAHASLLKAYLAAGDAIAAIASGDRALALGARGPELETLLGVANATVGRLDIAAMHFERAVTLAPENYEILQNLLEFEYRFGGSVNLVESPTTMRARQAALIDLSERERAGRLREGELEALLSLLSARPATFGNALRLCEQLSEDLAGLTLGVLGLMGRVFSQAGDLSRALAVQRFVFRGFPRTAESDFALGNLLISAGAATWDDGWLLMASAVRHLRPHTYITSVPEWTGEALHGQPLFVYSEQGVGDAILALRSLPILASRGIDVVLWVEAPLFSLAQSAPGYARIINSSSRPDPELHGCHVAIGLLNVFSVLGLSMHDLAAPTRLGAPPTRVPFWEARLDPGAKCRIGLAHIGNRGRSDHWLRSVPAGMLAPLAGIPDIEWVNLSVERGAELNLSVQQFKMIDWSEELYDFGETAALISNLDGVVAIDCSVAHLAAALGKPVWVLAPTLVDWRWSIEGAMSPWWPSVTLLRSTAPADWDAVVDELRGDVARFVSNRVRGDSV